MKTPCPSCPFLKTNFKEFAAVAERLCKKHGQPKPDFWACLSIRNNVVSEAIESGQLQCHSTVYDSDMSAHPETSQLCVGLEMHLTKEPQK